MTNDEQIQSWPTPTIFEKIIAAITMKTYTSGNLTIPTGSGNCVLTAAHGFGSVPNFYAASLVCVTADGSYSPGDVIPWSDITAGMDAFDGSSGQVGLFADAVHVGVVTLNVFSGMGGMIGQCTAVVKGGATSQAINVANWKIRFDAIGF